ncbi:MAG: cytochrome c [Proteobacteria bacterium]|nr:cytochrome c [Pseudomonadota bacterium]
MLRSAFIFVALVIFGISGSGEANAAGAKEVYDFYCSQCHGATGKGDGPNVTKDMPVTPRNFTNAAEMNKLSDKDLRDVIMDGGPALSKSSIMPPWSQTLTEGETTGLIKHIRKLCKCKGK